MPSSHIDVASEVDAALAPAGLTGYVYAKEIGRVDGPEVCLRADEDVVLASVFKIVVAIAYARAVDLGTLDPSQPTTVTSLYRTGGVGTGGAMHDVTISWRDLAELMMTLSDNAATDILVDRVGDDSIQRVISDLGLARTRISGRCLDEASIEDRELRAMQVEGLSPDRENAWDGVPEDFIRTLSTLDPAHSAMVSTPRDIGRLLEAIWTDEAGSAEACATVRGLMARQVSAHRIGSGFDHPVQLAGKTGTLEGIRNEASVVSMPDGRSFAVSMFTRSDQLAARNPKHDRAMGEAARRAVEHLRDH